MDWFDLLAVHGTLKSLLQHHSSKALILRRSAFFIVQLSHPYVTIGRTIALTRWTFIGKIMSLLFNMLSRLMIAFFPRSKCLFISRLQSPSAVILEPRKIKSDIVESNFLKNGTNELIYTQKQTCRYWKQCMVTKGGTLGGVNQVLGMNIHTQLHVR